jgi:hypothetical protein
MPNKDNLRLWVAALRSGEYRQTDAALNKDDKSFCCLGVACEVAMKHGISLKKEPAVGQASVTTTAMAYDGSDDYLPTAVRKWLGIAHRDPLLEKDDFGYKRTAAVCNDEGYDFLEIADLIEKKWKLKEKTNV